MRDLVGFFLVMLALSVLFGTLERLRPSVLMPRRSVRALTTDLAYWVLTPLVTKWLTRGAVIVVLVPVVIALGRERFQDLVAQGFGPVARLPWWAQAVLSFAILDLVGYWSHRAFHRGWLWRVHAVHHSSVRLDWLASVRVHPLNDAITRVLQVVPLLAIGMPLGVLAGVAPVFALYAIFLHANVRVDFGPLRYVIATPAFHRWHHAENCNFAGLFPIWDLLFGTFHLPRGVEPAVFGADLPVPEGPLAQWIFPFRRPRRSPLTPA